MSRRLVLWILIPWVAACSGEEHILQSLSQSPDLTADDVLRITAQVVETSQELGETTAVAVTDREGNVLGFYRMTGAEAGLRESAVTKARTAAYLSSNQHGFSTLTACFIIQSHFPPGVANTPGGPLYGVQFSSLPGGDVQPNGSGLSGSPGGMPLFKDGFLVGGIGVAGSGDAQNFDPALCSGSVNDEAIAASGAAGYLVAPEERGDVILVDGIRLLFQNAEAPAIDFALDPDDLGGFDEGPMDAPAPKFPVEGEVFLDDNHDYRFQDGSVLSVGEVEAIIQNAVEQAGRTRAAIRRPLGTSARVFVAVCDLDGTILGIYRTPDATLFSYDVAAQKARTAVAFSNPNHALGLMLREEIGVSENAPLAATTRALGFLGQNFYPPGIDEATLDRPAAEGPLFGLQEALGLSPSGNGITIFPGGIPLYKDGQLAGAIGVSGDGVDQDDYIASAGTEGFEAPPEIRIDQIKFQDVRLPYVKFPRRPELQ